MALDGSNIVGQAELAEELPSLSSHRGCLCHCPEGFSLAATEKQESIA